MGLITAGLIAAGVSASTAAAVGTAVTIAAVGTAGFAAAGGFRGVKAPGVPKLSPLPQATDTAALSSRERISRARRRSGTLFSRGLLGGEASIFQPSLGGITRLGD